MFFVGNIGYSKDIQYLIQEMEKLRSSLDINDPARVDLTLRLADLYFDASIKEGGKNGKVERKKQRLKALDLYKHSLNGTDGIKRAEGLNRIKIEFQAARLLTRLDEHKRAEAYYKSVLNNKETPKRMLEQASLALAEWYEEDGRFRLAGPLYNQAIKLCPNITACNYAHYRKAWLLFKNSKLTAGIQELKKSLWVSKTEIREPSLIDLIMFMSNEETTGRAELEYIEKIAVKLDRPELVKQLLEAFYVAGNRRAGSFILAHVNNKEPDFYNEIRLLEEVYGFREWEKVEIYLDKISKRTSLDIPKDKEKSENIKKIFRRFLVQVDAETNVTEDLYPYLKRSIESYLTIYPNDDLRRKLQQGWLKAEKDISRKIEFLGKWIKEDINYDVEKKKIRELRQTRLSLAQKLKKEDIVLEEALAIAEILKSSHEKDEFEYVAARTYYEKKDFKKAEKLFLGLVERSIENKNITNWAVMSQNLLLDIFNSEKRFDDIIKQVNFWDSGTQGVQSKKVLSEKKSMEKILLDARFEKAASRSETKESLESFFKFCLDGVYSKKSCPNAKVLAIKFKDQAKLVVLLEREKDYQALMNEYELMGSYSKAASLREKKNLSTKEINYDEYFKIALLYEMDQKWSSQKRILKQLIKKIKRKKSIPEKYEIALFVVLKEAELLDKKLLSFPWSKKKKIELAIMLHSKSPDSQTKKMILAEKSSLGPVWSKLVLEKLEKDYIKAINLKFYGRNSQRLFKRKTRAIDKLVKNSNVYLEGSDSETRIYILSMLHNTYQGITQDILNTPLPPDLDEATLNQVKGQLSGMAQPFEDTRVGYESLLTNELAGITDLENKKKIETNIASTTQNYKDLIKIESSYQKIAKIEKNEIDAMKNELLSNPEDQNTLMSLRDFYKNSNNKRIENYYSNRINSLKVQERL